MRAGDASVVDFALTYHEEEEELEGDEGGEDAQGVQSEGEASVSGSKDIVPGADDNKSEDKDE